MKRIFGILLILTVTLTMFASCASQSVSVSNNVTSTVTTQPREEEDPLDPSYQAVLKAIVNAHPWNAEQAWIYINGEALSYMYRGASLSEIGYALHDVDGDGVSELLLARIGDDVIYDMFTLSGNTARHVFGSEDRATYRLRTDGTVVLHWSGGAFVNGYDRYRFVAGQNELIFEMRVCHDNVYAESLGLAADTWFVSYTDTTYASYSTISKTEGQRLTAELEDTAMLQELAYTPLSELTFDHVSSTVDTQAPKTKSMLDYRSLTINDVAALYGPTYTVHEYLYQGGWGEIYYLNGEAPYSFFYSCTYENMGKPVSGNERLTGIGLSPANCADQTMLIHEGAPITMKASDFRAKFPDGWYGEDMDAGGMMYSYNYNGYTIAATWYDGQSERPADWIVVYYC